MKDNKTALILKLLTGKWLTIDELIPAMENKLQLVVGKARLYRLLSVMENAKQIDIRGKGDARQYTKAAA